MDNEEFSPVIDKKKKKKEKLATAQFPTDENSIKKETSVANDPQVEVNDTASAHAQTEDRTEQRKTIKAKHGLKPFAFFSGVFDIIAAAAIIGLGLWISFSIFNSVDTGVSEDLDTLFGIFLLPIIISVMAIAAVAGILYLVDGILSIVSSFKSDRKNWNGVIVAAAIFDVLLFFPAVFFSFLGGGNTQILSIALTVILVVTFIFKMVDISLTKRRLKKYQAAKEEEYKETYHGPDFSKLDKTVHDSAPLAQPQSSEQQSQDDEDQSGVDFSQLGK